MALAVFEVGFVTSPLIIQSCFLQFVWAGDQYFPLYLLFVFMFISVGQLTAGS